MSAQPLSSIEEWVGKTLPECQFWIMDGQTPIQLSTSELFGREGEKRKIVVFAVPGAFTPTCTVKHLPSFVQRIDDFERIGYTVICISSNDPFVMKHWGRHCGVSYSDESHSSDMNNAASKDDCENRSRSAIRNRLGSIRMVSDFQARWHSALDVTQDATAKGLGVRPRRWAGIIVDSTLVYAVEGGVESTGAEAMIEHAQRVSLEFDQGLSSKL